MTFFNSQYNAFNVNLYNKILHIPQLQGADTYAIPTAILQKHMMQSYPLTYTKFILFLQYIYAKCPESYYNDDFLISFAVRASKIHLHSLWSRHIVYKNNDNNHNSELHLDILDGENKNKTKVCLYNEATSIMKMWGIPRGSGSGNKPKI